MVFIAQRATAAEAQSSNREKESGRTIKEDARRSSYCSRCYTSAEPKPYKKELQVFARNKSVDLFEDRELVAQGWEGQPKGLMQVLWERGLIDTSSLEQYTLDGRKNPITGEVNLHSSLCHILANCNDFKDEETALEYLGTQLGVTVKLTPKFHAELAGEGIEYSWAHSKSFYRRLPLSQKKGRENFKQLVRECTCPERVLTKVRIEKFAARARAYICT